MGSIIDGVIVVLFILFMVFLINGFVLQVGKRKAERLKKAEEAKLRSEQREKAKETPDENGLA